MRWIYALLVFIFVLVMAYTEPDAGLSRWELLGVAAGVAGLAWYLWG